MGWCLVCWFLYGCVSVCPVPFSGIQACTEHTMLIWKDHFMQICSYWIVLLQKQTLKRSVLFLTRQKSCLKKMIRFNIVLSWSRLKICMCVCGVCVTIILSSYAALLHSWVCLRWPFVCNIYLEKSKSEMGILQQTTIKQVDLDFNHTDIKIMAEFIMMLSISVKSAYWNSSIFVVAAS